MLRTVFGVARFCLKKICAAFVTAAVKTATVLTTAASNLLDMVTDTTTWVAKQLEPVPVKRICSMAIARQVILFVGGLVCCFVFSDEAKGDLTWFEKMLMSTLDWANICVTQTKARVTDWLFSSKECEIT